MEETIVLRAHHIGRETHVLLQLIAAKENSGVIQENHISPTFSRVVHDEYHRSRAVTWARSGYNDS